MIDRNDHRPLLIWTNINKEIKVQLLVDVSSYRMRHKAGDLGLLNSFSPQPQKNEFVDLYNLQEKTPLCVCVMFLFLSGVGKD